MIQRASTTIRSGEPGYLWDRMQRRRLTDAQKTAKIREYLQDYDGLDPNIFDIIIQRVKKSRKIRQASGLFGNPLEVVCDLIEKGRSHKTILAALLAGTVKTEGVSKKAYRASLNEIQRTFGSDIARYVDHSLRLAYERQPEISPAFEERMQASDEEVMRFRAAERLKRRTIQGYREKSRKSLRDIQNERSIAIIRAKGYVDEAWDIRFSERAVRHRKIDLDNPTFEDRALLTESLNVHAKIALAASEWAFYNEILDLHERVHYPAAYKATQSFMKELARELDEPMERVVQQVTQKLTALGLQRVISLPRDLGRDLPGDFHVSWRPKRPGAVCRKYREKGIDPLIYFTELEEKIKANPKNRLRILLTEVIKDSNIFDFAGLRTIILPDPVIAEGVARAVFEPLPPEPPPVLPEMEKATNTASIKERKKMQQEQRRWERKRDLLACGYVSDLINTICISDEINAVHGDPIRVPGRDINYVERPKRNEYQSQHSGMAVVIELRLEGESVFRVHVPLESQVRSWRMHQVAVLGSAAHGRYTSSPVGDWEKGSLEVAGERFIYPITPDGEILKLERAQLTREEKIKLFGKDADLDEPQFMAPPTVLDLAAKISTGLPIVFKHAEVWAVGEHHHPLEGPSAKKPMRLTADKPVPNGQVIRIVKKEINPKKPFTLNREFLEAIINKLATVGAQRHMRDVLNALEKRDKASDQDPNEVIAKLQLTGQVVWQSPKPAP